jgi:hypothetical protein
MTSFRRAHDPRSLNKKAPALRGPFRHFDFCDCDLIRSKSCRNSAVSSSIDFGGGLGGKGITSDIGRTSLVMQARAGRLLSRPIVAFLRRKYFVNAAEMIPADVESHRGPMANLPRKRAAASAAALSSGRVCR